MAEYRDKPTEFIQPDEAALKARNRRSVWIALGLAAFMIFAFLTVLSRSGVI